MAAHETVPPWTPMPSMSPVASVRFAGEQSGDLVTSMARRRVAHAMASDPSGIEPGSMSISVARPVPIRVVRLKRSFPLNRQRA